jgi:hypothetical protein
MFDHNPPLQRFNDQDDTPIMPLMSINVISRLSRIQHLLDVKSEQPLIFVARPKITDAADNPFRLSRASRIRDCSEPSVAVREHMRERARTQKTRRRRGEKTRIA